MPIIHGCVCVCVCVTLFGFDSMNDDIKLENVFYRRLFVVDILLLCFVCYYYKNYDLVEQYIYSKRFFLKQNNFV